MKFEGESVVLFDIVLGSPVDAIRPPLSSWGLTLAALLLCIRLDAVIELVEGKSLGIAKLALQVSAVLLLSATLGPAWKHQWEFANWPGPPAWMSAMFEVIVGASAWSIATEMVVSLCVFLGLITIAVNLWSAVRPSFAWLREMR